MKKAGKKIGLFFLCLVPMGLSLLLPLIGMLICTLINAVVNLKRYGVWELFEDNTFPEVIDLGAMTFVGEVFMVAGFAIIYYVIMKAKDLKRPKEAFSGKSFMLILLLMVGANCILGVALEGLNQIFPSVIEDYNELMKVLDPSSIGMLLAAVVLAPIGEEIAFRGMTFRFARKMTGSFMVGNIIQALLFGIAHGNIVQGTYAFGMGIVLGYLYRRYNSLTATIVAHFMFNFLGLFLGDVFYFLGDAPLLKAFLTLATGILVVWVSLKLMKSDPAVIKGTEEFDRPVIVDAKENLEEE